MGSEDRVADKRSSTIGKPGPDPNHPWRLTDEAVEEKLEALLEGRISRHEAVAWASTWRVQDPEGVSPQFYHYTDAGYGLNILANVDISPTLERSQDGPWLYRESDLRELLAIIRWEPVRADADACPDLFRPIRPHTRSIRFSDTLACFPLHPDAFEQRTGIHFPVHYVNGMGPGSKLALETASGDLGELHFTFSKTGRTIMCLYGFDVGENGLELLAILLDLFEIPIEQCLMHENYQMREIRPARPEHAFSLYRQDDNGNRFLMQRFFSRAYAERIAREFEAHGHKQNYWVEADELAKTSS